MAESIVKFQRKGGFTVLPTTMLRDKRLSLKTKGLFAVMISLPEGWEYSVSGLAAINGVGRDTIRSALKEMESAGYLTRERSHGEGGKFSGNVYLIQEESALPGPSPENPAMAERPPEDPGADAPSSGFPTSGEPTLDEPTADNPPQSNIDLQNIDLINPPIAPQGGPPPVKQRRRKRAAKSIPQWKPERFEGFWTFYPRGEDRVGAVEEWDKLRPSDELINTMARALAQQKETEEWRAGIGIPHACRWLRKRRWEDVPLQAASPAAAASGRTVPSEVLPTWT